MQNNNNCFNGFLMDFVTFDPSEVIRDAYCLSNFHENNAFIPHVKKKSYIFKLTNCYVNPFILCLNTALTTNTH